MGPDAGSMASRLHVLSAVTLSVTRVPFHCFDTAEMVYRL